MANAKGVIKRATRIQKKTGMSSHDALGLAVKRAKAYRSGVKSALVANRQQAAVNQGRVAPTRKPTTAMSQPTIDAMRGRGTGRNRGAVMNTNQSVESLMKRLGGK